VLHWVRWGGLAPDDERALFPVFGARAAPGARLMFTSGPEAGTAMGVFGGDPLRHACLSPTEYCDLLAKEGSRSSSSHPRIPTTADIRSGWCAGGLA